MRNTDRWGWTGKLLFAVAAVIQLAACSRTVQWDEEVPLNTGQTIWVHRSANYVVKGDAGNPLDMALRPEADQTIEFSWAGKQYEYKGDANVRVLAISPANTPVLIAAADDNSWYARHGYACTTPFYVELIPDATGRSWSWPAHIEPWLLDHSTNLLLRRDSPDTIKPRYTAAERDAANAPAFASIRSQRTIEPTYVGISCDTRR
jgi:hypothetical protein